jgi:hypothetical protein
MSNVQNVDRILESLSRSAPFIAMLTAAGAFTLVGVFKADYYGGVLADRWGTWSMIAGTSIALVTELSRAVLLLMSFKDFREGKVSSGIWGLVLSVGLVVYDCIAAGPISSLWIGSHTGTLGVIIRDVVVFLVVLSFGIEIRLSISGKRKTGEKVQEEAERAYTAFKLPQNGKIEHTERGPIGFKGSVATDDAELLRLALKGAKSYHSAYRSKPRTENNQAKQAK